MARHRLMVPATEGLRDFEDLVREISAEWKMRWDCRPRPALMREALARGLGFRSLQAFLTAQPNALDLIALRARCTEVVAWMFHRGPVTKSARVRLAIADVRDALKFVVDCVGRTRGGAGHVGGYPVVRCFHPRGHASVDPGPEVRVARSHDGPWEILDQVADDDLLQLVARAVDEHYRPPLIGHGANESDASHYWTDARFLHGGRFWIVATAPVMLGHGRFAMDMAIRPCR